MVATRSNLALKNHSQPLGLAWYVTSHGRSQIARMLKSNAGNPFWTTRGVFESHQQFLVMCVGLKHQRSAFSLSAPLGLPDVLCEALQGGGRTCSCRKPVIWVCLKMSCTPITQWFCWSLSLWKMAISLGRLTQHFQLPTHLSRIRTLQPAAGANCDVLIFYV